MSMMVKMTKAPTLGKAAVQRSVYSLALKIVFFERL